MVNYASNELKNNNGSRLGIPKGIIYDNTTVLFMKSTINPKICEATIEIGEYEYEGIFMNGKLCGLGKCFKNGKKIYDGEFLNGEFHGKGKLYFTNANLKYEGEFANGEFNRYGKLYYRDGNLKYEGGFANGEFNGYGRLYYKTEFYCEDEPLKYEGEFANGKYDGVGKLYNIHGGFKYKGEFSKGEFNGKGKLYSQDSSFIYHDPIWYEGDFFNGKIYGKGKFIDYKGNIYEGEFSNDHIVGPGQKIMSNKRITINGCFDTVSIKEILDPEEAFTMIIPKLNGKATISFKDDFEFDHCTSYYIDGKTSGKTHFYDSNNRKVLSTEGDYESMRGNCIEYRYTSSEIEYREFKIENGEKKYLHLDYNGDAPYTKGEPPVYWHVFNPSNDENCPELDEKESYYLLIDILDNKAHTEVDIICPWIGKWTKDTELRFFKALKKALKRGVTVKIITGMGDMKKEDVRCRKTWYNAKEIVESLGDCKKNLHFKEEYTHEKLLLCDNDLEMFGSHNLTSNKPNNNSWSERMRCYKDANKIRERRKKRFNFSGRDVIYKNIEKYEKGLV